MERSGRRHSNSGIYLKFIPYRLVMNVRGINNAAILPAQLVNIGSPSSAQPNAGGD
jgi:hypothetical protein